MDDDRQTEIERFKAELAAQSRAELAQHKASLEKQIRDAVSRVAAESSGSVKRKPVRRRRKKPSEVEVPVQKMQSKFGRALNNLIANSLDDHGVQSSASATSLERGVDRHLPARQANRTRKQMRRKHPGKIVPQRNRFENNPLARSARKSGIQSLSNVRRGAQERVSEDEKEETDTEIDEETDEEYYDFHSYRKQRPGQELRDAAEENLDNTTKQLLARSRQLVEGNVATIRHFQINPSTSKAAVARYKNSDAIKQRNDAQNSGLGIAEHESSSDIEDDEKYENAEKEDGDSEGEDGSPRGEQQVLAAADIPAVEHAPLPASLGDREWENEVARNIVTLYSTTLHQEKLDKAISHTGKTEKGVLSDSKSRMMKGKSSKNSERETRLPLLRSQSQPRMRGPQAKAKSAAASQLRSQSKAQTGGSSSSSNHNHAHSLAEALNPSPSHVGVRSVNYSWQASHIKDGKVVVNMPPVPTQIWFMGSGTVAAVWDALADDDGTRTNNDGHVPQICSELQSLEACSKYSKYVAVVEGLLSARLRTHGIGELEQRLWTQLVVTCNAFSMRCVDEKKFAEGLELMKRAEALSEHHEVVEAWARPQLKAFIFDSYAYYYYKRNKCNAALQCVNKAMRTHVRRQEYDHVAKCHLHTGAILAKLKNHDESVRCMGQVLSMVESQQLETGGASAQKICMVAVCYHNIAVQQLKLRRYQEACVSSQNARRLARLSLSFSNKWLKVFEGTHKHCLAALAAENAKNSSASSSEQADQNSLFKNLSAALYT